MRKSDVIIVGGGPAGSSCAWHLRRNHVDCVVLDQHTFPRPKPCAGWITPEVFRDLELDPSEYPLGLTHFSSFDISIRKIHFRLHTRQYAIRRLEFDDWLLKRSGAILENHSVKSITSTRDGYVVDGQYIAKYLVGAGGTHCPVRKAFYGTPHMDFESNLIVAMEEEFPYDIVDDHCYLWFLQNDLPGYSWYVPKSGGYLNIGIGAKASDLKSRNDHLKKHWNSLIEYLAELGLVHDHTYQPGGHSYYLHRRLDKIQKDNIFLVGDSAGLATLDMGEGIGPAIRSGHLAAESIVTGKPYSLSSIQKYSFLSILKHGLIG